MNQRPAKITKSFSTHLFTFLALASLFIFSSVFTSCQTVDFDYSENHFAVNNSQIYITKINLAESGTQLIFKIDTDNFFTIQEFAEQTNATYAINTTPYFYDQNNQAQLLGITKINGQVISESVNKYSALSFYFNDQNQLTAKILQNQNDEEIAKYPTVIGGYFTILKNGEILEYKKNRRSRTAVGLNGDGTQIYVLSVFSNLKSDLSGLTYMECAQILQELGCTDAMEFDGGTSTALFSKDFGAISTKNADKIPAALGFFVSSNE